MKQIIDGWTTKASAATLSSSCFRSCLDDGSCMNSISSSEHLTTKVGNRLVLSLLPTVSLQLWWVVSELMRTLRYLQMSLFYSRRFASNCSESHSQLSQHETDPADGNLIASYRWIFSIPGFCFCFMKTAQSWSSSLCCCCSHFKCKRTDDGSAPAAFISLLCE